MKALSIKKEDRQKVKPFYVTRQMRGHKLGMRVFAESKIEAIAKLIKWDKNTYGSLPILEYQA